MAEGKTRSTSKNEIRLADEVRYAGGVRYEVAVFRDGELTGFLNKRGEFVYALLRPNRYSHKQGRKLMLSKKASSFVERGYTLGLIQITTQNIAVAWRLP
jgi:hypothetical protein